LLLVYKFIRGFVSSRAHFDKEVPINSSTIVYVRGLKDGKGEKRTMLIKSAGIFLHLHSLFSAFVTPRPNAVEGQRIE